MQDHYEINVSKKDKKGDGYFHFFATHERSLTTEKEMQEALEIFKKAFPEPEYHIIVEHWEFRGKLIFGGI